MEKEFLQEAEVELSKLYEIILENNASTLTTGRTGGALESLGGVCWSR